MKYERSHIASAFSQVIQTLQQAQDASTAVSRGLHNSLFFAADDTLRLLRELERKKKPFFRSSLGITTVNDNYVRLVRTGKIRRSE